jgi:hypothetical protein
LGCLRIENPCRKGRQTRLAAHYKCWAAAGWEESLRPWVVPFSFAQGAYDSCGGFPSNQLHWKLLNTSEKNMSGMGDISDFGRR